MKNLHAIPTTPDTHDFFLIRPQYSLDFSSVPIDSFVSLSFLFESLRFSSFFLKGSSSAGSFIFTLSGLLWFMSNNACKSKVFASSLLSLGIFVKVFSNATDICSNMNRTKQRASPRFANATAAPSQITRSLKCVIQSTFASFKLFLSSESYSCIVSPVIHQACLSCNVTAMPPCRCAVRKRLTLHKPSDFHVPTVGLT